MLRISVAHGNFSQREPFPYNKTYKSLIHAYENRVASFLYRFSNCDLVRVKEVIFVS
jgi:hypothetical protein